MTDRQQETLLRILVATQRQTDVMAAQFAVMQQQALATRDSLGAAIAQLRGEQIDPRQTPQFETFDSDESPALTGPTARSTKMGRTATTPTPPKKAQKPTSRAKTRRR